MSRGPDVIRWVIDWMMTNDDSITQDLAMRCEREARAEWGGQSVPYIAKTCAADRRAQVAAARAAVSAGVPVAQAARQAGIGRSSLYAHLSEPGREGAAVGQDGKIGLGQGGRFGVRRSP